MKRILVSVALYLALAQPAQARGIVAIAYDVTAVSGKTITQISLFVDRMIAGVQTFPRQKNAVGLFEIRITASQYVLIEAIQINDSRGWDEQPVGICFNGVNIPPGATILTATTQLRVHEMEPHGQSLCSSAQVDKVRDNLA